VLRATLTIVWNLQKVVSTCRGVSTGSEPPVAEEKPFHGYFTEGRKALPILERGRL
jgi:hypothetical protein